MTMCFTWNTENLLAWVGPFVTILPLTYLYPPTRLSPVSGPFSHRKSQLKSGSQSSSSAFEDAENGRELRATSYYVTEIIGLFRPVNLSTVRSGVPGAVEINELEARVAFLCASLKSAANDDEIHNVLKQLRSAISEHTEAVRRIAHASINGPVSKTADLGPGSPQIPTRKPVD